MDKAVVKSLGLLELLCEAPEPLGVSHLSRVTGLPKSNVHRTLQTLIGLGYAVQPAEGVYAATLKPWYLGSKVLARVDLREVAHPHLVALTAATGETTVLALLEGQEALYVDKVESAHPVRIHAYVGARAPVYSTAPGKALLAFQSKEFIAAVEQNLQPFNDKTIISRAKLLRELQSIRAAGFARSFGEWREGVWAVAVPVRNGAGAVVASIAIVGPAQRLGEKVTEGMVPGMLRASDAVSRALGYTGPALGEAA